MFSTKYQAVKLISAFLLFATFTTGCGGRANPVSKEPQANPGVPGGVTGGGTTTPPPSTGGGSILGDGAPPITYTFSLAGPTDSKTLPTFQTDSLLKVRVKPGPAGTINVPNSAFSANYFCINYVVSALGYDVRSKTVQINGGWDCPQAETSDTIDFSSRLTPGHGPITLKVSAARYDFKYVACTQFPYLFNAQMFGCGLYYPTVPIYTTHVVTGDLEVFVNGTAH